jgi:hypothetical protein
MIPEQFVGASGFGDSESQVSHQAIDHGNQSRRHTMLSQQSGIPQLQVDELSTYYPGHDNQLEAASFYDGSTGFPEGSTFIEERSA